MIFRTLISFVLLGFALVVRAEVREESQAKFAATLIVTDKEVRVPVQTMRRSEKSLGIVKLTGCKEDANGKCDVVGDIQIFNPKGKLDVEIKDAELWKDRPPHRENLSSAPYLEFAASTLPAITAKRSVLRRKRIECCIAFHLP